MKYLIALNEINGLGPVAIKKLVDHFENGKNIFNSSYNDLSNAGLTTTIISEIHKKAILEKANRWIELANKNSIQIISYRDKEYPKMLLEISALPTIIYIKGSVDILNNQRSIAIVGTRNPD